MGKLIMNGVPYGAAEGIIPNPFGSPSDTLATIEIGNTIYNIDSGNYTRISNGAIYSEEEQVIGVWTNGKPLYQITVDCGAGPTSDSSKYVSLPSSAAAAEMIWVESGFCKNLTTNNYSSLPINLVRPDGGANQIGCFINTQGQIRIIAGGTDRSNLNVYVTIRYTKTTDRSGSPGYEAYRFSPVIYSFEEREIGVWTDNKPLYQRTYDLGSSQFTIGTSWTNSTILTDNKEMIAYCAGSTTAGAYRGGIEVNISSQGSPTQYIQFRVPNQVSVRYITLQYTKSTDTPGSSIYTFIEDNRTGYVEEDLYSNPNSTSESTVNLSNNLYNYDEINFVIEYIENNIKYTYPISYCSRDLAKGNNIQLYARDTSKYVSYTVTNSSVLTLIDSGAGCILKNIRGIKYNGRGGGGASQVGKVSIQEVRRAVEGITSIIEEVEGE